MLGWVAHFEEHGDFRIEGLLPFEIIGGEKSQAIDARLEPRSWVEKFRDAAVIVGDASADFEKASFAGLSIQHGTDAVRGQTSRGI